MSIRGKPFKVLLAIPHITSVLVYSKFQEIVFVHFLCLKLNNHDISIELNWSSIKLSLLNSNPILWHHSSLVKWYTTYKLVTSYLQHLYITCLHLQSDSTTPKTCTSPTFVYRYMHTHKTNISRLYAEHTIYHHFDLISSSSCPRYTCYIYVYTIIINRYELDW